MKTAGSSKSKSDEKPSGGRKRRAKSATAAAASTEASESAMGAASAQEAASVSRKDSTPEQLSFRYDDKSAPTSSVDSGKELFLPFQAELMPASNRCHEETVLFVHHFGGSKQTVQRHLRLVNDLGYDAVRFDLIINEANPGKRLPITADLKFGIRHVWTEQIEAILNAIPGRKIIYSFSMPSNSALDAIARRQAEDIAGWICDGGPFLELPRCIWNLYTHQYAVKSRLLRGAFTGASLVLYGTGFEEEAPRFMRSLPKGFPIFSVRGWKDELVPPAAIDQVLFERNDLALDILALPEGHHLDGLKRFREEYSSRLERFLSQVRMRSSTVV